MPRSCFGNLCQDKIFQKNKQVSHLIPQKTVQEILETAKIEDVIQDFVNLRRRGVNMIGLCPFHNEKTPSFTVSPAKNIFKCFGCGKAGDPAKFIMEHEHLTYPDALRYLARKYRIEVEEVQLTPEAVAQQQAEESLYILNEYARQFYQDQLFETDMGKSIGLSYFKGRGFREDTIRKFGLGYAPNEYEAFVKKATQSRLQARIFETARPRFAIRQGFFPQPGDVYHPQPERETHCLCRAHHGKGRQSAQVHQLA
jgi:DNA primase